MVSKFNAKKNSTITIILLTSCPELVKTPLSPLHVEQQLKHLIVNRHHRFTEDDVERPWDVIVKSEGGDGVTSGGYRGATLNHKTVCVCVHVCVCACQQKAKSKSTASAIESVHLITVLLVFTKLCAVCGESLYPPPPESYTSSQLQPLPSLKLVDVVEV